MRNYDLLRSGVELGQYARFPTPMDLGPYARLRYGRNVAWGCIFSSYDARCEMFWISKSAILSKWARFSFLPITLGIQCAIVYFQFQMLV